MASRIDELWHGQACLLSPGPVVEELAQRYAAQLIARRAAQTGVEAENPPPAAERFAEVDLSTLELVRPRAVGVEHVAPAAMRQWGFEEKLTQLGFNRPQVAAAVGSVIGRMAAPGSELSTYDGLQQRSALGELLDYHYQARTCSSCIAAAIVCSSIARPWKPIYSEPHNSCSAWAIPV